MNTAEYKTALSRLAAATTIEELARLERSLERIYEAGFFTTDEYYDLDTRLNDKAADQF
jgi:hypothetical protein